MEFHNRIDWYTGDLWAAVEDRFGKINRQEELRKEEKYLPEPVLEKNDDRRVVRTAELKKIAHRCECSNLMKNVSV